MRIKNKRGREKTRQWIRRRDERGYFNNIVKELAIEDTAEYKDMMRMSHAVFQRILSYIEEDITRKQVLCGNKVISPKERLALTINHTKSLIGSWPHTKFSCFVTVFSSMVTMVTSS